MNPFVHKSIWRIRHTDEMRSILEVGSEQLRYMLIHSPDLLCLPVSLDCICSAVSVDLAYKVLLHNCTIL